MAEQEEAIKGIDRSGRWYFGVALPRGHIPVPSEVRRDPWLAWTVAVERAKRGDFEPVRHVMQLYDPAGDYALNFQCVILVGDAGPEGCFGPIAESLESRTDPNGYETDLDFAYALSIRGRLGDIPLLLRTYNRLVGIEDADVMHVYISYMLAREQGEFQYPSEFQSMEDYARPIMERYEELLRVLGGGDTLVFRGEPFGVVRLANRILGDLRQPYFMPDLRRRFEACTGIDCTAFFQKGELQPLAAAAIVEEFLYGRAALGYRDGVRYFFAHPIPQ